jgi:flavin reductase (DIM6/NTAB) family NADH-FMN oxidoreductase RutF
MTKLSASATVITTTSTTGIEPRGLTVSSLTSLSLNPAPLVSFNLQLPSRTSEILHERNVFAVNIVPGTPQIRDLVIAFAGGYGHDVNPFEKFSSMFTVPAKLAAHKQESHNHEREGDIEEFKHAQNIPVIKDALAVLYCRKHQIFKVQDHEIWVAEVFHVDATNCNDSNATTLLYQNRSFHSLGSVLD